MRMVLDTDVVVAALRSPAGASAALLLAALDRRITLVANVPLVIEYEAVCSRAEHQQAAGVSTADAQVFLDGVAALIEPVETHFLWRPRLRDPNDEMVLEAAVNGHADLLVTFNRRDYGVIPLQFGIEVLSPRDALRRITP
ncbi:MAG: putative toxin-antitoxin system toxin component, PIN family [Candidatus Competibacteraceae bacterium]|nr:MAG: putative toxin-antitoxin system toxin component, PIN family [Candidatus Competibacteraceae bacterium]